MKAVFDNLLQEKPVNHFTVWINDDVTLSHSRLSRTTTRSPGHDAVHVLGSWLRRDGRSEPRRDLDHRHEHGHVRPGLLLVRYHKSGGVTASHLRVGKQPSKTQYPVQNVDYAACHTPNHVKKYKMFEAVNPESTFILNCAWDMAALEQLLPGSLKRVVVRKHLKLYTVNAIKIGQEVGLGRRIHMIVQTIIFKFANVTSSRRRSSSSRGRSRRRTTRRTKRQQQDAPRDLLCC